MNDRGADFKAISLLVIAGVLIIIVGLVVLSFLLRPPEAPTNVSTQQAPLLSSDLPTFPPNTATATTIPTLSDAATELPVPTLAVWSPLPPVVQESRGLLTNGNRSEYKVALTFDLCEAEGDLAGYDAGIIQILNDTQTPATLFLGGLWMRDHQTETVQLSSNPLFELGNHSWSHKDFSAITNDEAKQEVLLTQQIMYDLLGYQTNIFRLPYGTYNDEALNTINDQGLYIIQWDDVSGDPDPNIDAESMTSWVLQQAQPGSIIIMHANGRGWHTAEALPGIIQSLRSQGYTLVTISDLLGLQPYK